ARLDRAVVQEDGAGPAACSVAADVGAGEADRLADEVDQQQPGLDFGAVLLAVDGDGDGDTLGGRPGRRIYAHSEPPVSALWARSTARESARNVIVRRTARL